MAYSLINHTAKEGSTTAVTTNAIDTTGATLIVLVLSTAVAPINLVTDTQNNKWFYAKPRLQNTQAVSIIFCVNPVTDPSHTFAFSISAGFPSVAVLVFSGNAAGSEQETDNGVNAGTIQPGSLTPAEDNAVIVTGFSGGSATTQSIGGGFTISDQIGGSSGQRVAAAYLIQTSKGAANPTWTDSSGGANISAMMASFPLQSSGGGGSSSSAYASA